MTNNRKSTHRKFKNQKQVPKEALKQKIFCKHFCSYGHNGIQVWVITLIEQLDAEESIRYVLPKWLQAEKDFCILLITRIPFNRFSLLLLNIAIIFALANN